MLDEPNITFEELHKIAIPVHILAGEKDVIKLEHTKLIAENIKNSTLKIILKRNTWKLYCTFRKKIYEILKRIFIINLKKYYIKRSNGKNAFFFCVSHFRVTLQC